MFRVSLALIAVGALVPFSFAQVERGAPLPRKAALGTGFAALTPEEAKTAGLAAGLQAKISTVVPGLTGASLGVKPGDIILKFADQPFTGVRMVQDYLRKQVAGDPVSLVVWRDGKQVTLSGKLVEKPKQKSDQYDVTYDQVVSKGKRIRVIITAPKGQKSGPTVFLIGGIGQYSIDGEFAGTAYGNILEPIAKAGYTIVRVDKPGQGDSEGPEYTSLLFDDELDAYLQALKLVKTLPSVDKDRIAIFGHSMGGAFGPLVAAAEPVTGLAVNGTMSKTWLEYTLENTRRQTSLAGAAAGDVDDMMHGLSEVCHYIYNRGMSPAEIKKAHPELSAAVDDHSPDGKTTSGVGLPFFQQLAKKNLIGAWAKLNSKVLVTWGANDFISTGWDHEFIVETVNKLRPGTAELKILSESDHGFNKTSSFKDSMTRWGKGGEFNPNIIEALKSWLDKVLAKP